MKKVLWVSLIFIQQHLYITINAHICLSFTCTDKSFLISVTKKEYIYESASEDESDKNTMVPEIKEEKQPQKTSEKKNSASSESNTSPQKGGKGKKAKKNLSQNQPTLMNFFKKK